MICDLKKIDVNFLSIFTDQAGNYLWTLYCQSFTGPATKYGDRIVPESKGLKMPVMDWKSRVSRYSPILLNGYGFWYISQIAKFMGPTWGPPGSCRPQMGPMLAPLTLLSGVSGDIGIHLMDSLLRPRPNDCVGDNRDCQLFHRSGGGGRRGSISPS